jgi:hypothetical protein
LRGVLSTSQQVPIRMFISTGLGPGLTPVPDPSDYFG